jgi:preprotein translocase subunit SecD
MMKPILDPVSAFTMSEESAKTWTQVTAETLEDYMAFYSTDDEGHVNGAVTPIAIVSSPELREQLREAVTRYIDASFAGIRDAANQGQMFKATATNPGSTFNLGLTSQTE